MPDTDSVLDQQSNTKTGREEDEQEGAVLGPDPQNLRINEDAGSGHNQVGDAALSPFATAAPMRLDHASSLNNAAASCYPEDPEVMKAQILATLRARVAAAEAESAKHVQIISSMHTWAAKTTNSLRQIQEKCESAESKATNAEREMETLRDQLAAVAAQVEAMTMDSSSFAPLNVERKGGGKRRKKANIPRLASQGDGGVHVGGFSSADAINNNKSVDAFEGK